MEGDTTDGAHAEGNTKATRVSLQAESEEGLDEDGRALAKACDKLINQEILHAIYCHMFGQVDIDSFAIEDGKLACSSDEEEDWLSNSHSSDSAEAIPIAAENAAATESEIDGCTIHMPDQRLLGDVPASVKAALYTQLCSWLREVFRVVILLEKDKASMFRREKRIRTEEVGDFVVLQAISLTNKRRFP